MVVAVAWASCMTVGGAAQPEFAWRQLGPAAAGGRVAAVAGTDLNPYLYYLGAAGGGVFKTIDGGLRWHDVWTAQTVGAIGAIAISPRDQNDVWVGTGEPFPRNDASNGDGIWRTRDGGAHWTWLGLPKSWAIAGISLDPRDPNVAIAAALGDPFRDGGERGIYRTADGGRTWTRALYAGPQSGACDLARDAQHPGVMYACIWQIRRRPWTFTSGGDEDGLYRSSDGGRSWRRLSGDGLPRGIMGRIGIAIAPSDSKRIYALIQSTSGLLWRSDDGGSHWRLMSRDTLIDQRPFYFSRLIVDPTDRDHVFFASEDLIETWDGGRTFRDLSDAVHQDHHGFWISRNGRRL
ncbi:MAG: glycosyl hydrolase, partial [Candidatus Eremiobacteraeota bacterium]|nr:glycosyl hydrolase [Candidatus Eremiobacteraeota bacterium]